MVSENEGMEEREPEAEPKPVVDPRPRGGKSGLQKNLADTTNLVRSIQRAEGNPDCFQKADGYCDRLDCSWRRYCLREGLGRPEEEGNR